MELLNHWNILSFTYTHVTSNYRYVQFRWLRMPPSSTNETEKYLTEHVLTDSKKLSDECAIPCGRPHEGYI